MFFGEILQFDKFEDAVSNMKIVFQNFTPKMPKQGILGHKFSQLFFEKILQFDLIEGADLRYDNSFLKF